MAHPLLLVIPAVALPALALLVERAGRVRISERHHSHHDTYVVPVSFTRSLVIAMAFMGCLGIVLAVACAMVEFFPTPDDVLVFFDSFIATAFLMWWVIRRYKVSVFSDHLVVTPFFGSHVLVLYDEIDLLEWAGTRKGSGYRDLVIWAGGHGTVRISGMVDVEQILMAIDRFDALPRVKGGILS